MCRIIQLLLLSIFFIASANQKADAKIYTIIDDTLLVINDSTESVQKHYLPNNSAVCQKIRKVILPNSISEIGSYAFESFINLRDINLSDSINNINFNAFSNCSKLPVRLLLYKNGESCYGWIGDRNLCVDIRIPEGVREIDYQAFSDCRKLTAVTLPNSLENISAKAFQGCTQLKSIQLPSSLKSINHSVFQHCDSLQEIVLPEGILSIADSSFKDCVSLTSVKIPSTLKSIDEYAFAECPKLKRINIHENIEEIDDSAFHRCTPETKNILFQNGFCISEEDTLNISEVRGDTLFIKEGITCIPTRVFAWKKYKHIVLPQSTKIIRNGAFSGWSHLQSIHIPDAVEKIGNNAFINCKNLKTILFSKNLKSIGISAFNGCRKLDRVILPDSLKEIGNEIFGNCTNLKSVVFPDGIEQIPNSCFYDCKHLEKVILGKNVKFVSHFAFYNCYRLSEINLPNNCEIDSNAFLNCYYLQLPKEILQNKEKACFENCGNRTLGIFTIIDEYIAQHIYSPIIKFFDHLSIILFFLIMAELFGFVTLFKDVTRIKKLHYFRSSVVIVALLILSGTFIEMDQYKLSTIPKMLYIVLLTTIGYFIFKKFPKTALGILIGASILTEFVWIILNSWVC